MTGAEKAGAIQQARFASSRALAGLAFFGGAGWLGFAAMGGRELFVAAFGPAKWLMIGGAVWYIIAEINRNLAERKSKS